ncbi:hypothetical protein V6N13_005985 [Hibiscus sabdariffa]
MIIRSKPRKCKEPTIKLSFNVYGVDGGSDDGPTKPNHHHALNKIDLLKPALARLSAKQSLPLGTKSCAYSRSDSIQKELYILRQFQDSNKIVKCFDDVVSLEKGVTVYNVFLEYASGGTLRDLIRRYDGNIPEPFVKCYTKILFEGLRCIHAEGYLHCDLKLENIFVFLGRGSDVTLKIVDFGLVRRDNENHAVEGGLKELKFPGTPLYMPLETIVKHHICLALDTWSLGCVVLQMITGKLPCDGMKDKMELAIKILFSRNPPNQIRKTLSDQGKDFLMKCFAREPGERWTVDMLLSHPFITTTQEKSDDCLPSTKELKACLCDMSIFC